MPSYLTRYVFRCLLANEHIIHTGCLHRNALPRLRAAQRIPISSGDRNSQARRGFFNLATVFKSSRDETTSRFPPGLEIMMDYEKKRRMQARLPEIREVDAAVWQFLSAKLEASSACSLPDTQAKLLLDNLQYLTSASSPHEEIDGAQSQLPTRLESSLALTGKLLARHKTPFTEQHLNLAQFVAEATQSKAISARSYGLFGLVSTLCRAGRPQSARDILVQSGLLEFDVDDTGPVPEKSKERPKNRVREVRHNARKCLREIVAAFAALDEEAGMLSVVNLNEHHDLKRDDRVVGAFIAFYDRRKDSASLEKWINVFLTDCDSRLSPSTLRLILNYCVQPPHQNLGRSVIREVMKDTPPKVIWDEVLAWNFTLNKSVDDVQRQIEVMVNANDKSTNPDTWRVPDTATINRLVEVAIDANDPYLAERLITLGKDRGIKPDAQTLVLQMQYRLNVNDIDGALNAYKHLQVYDTTDNEDVPVVNQLLVALCDSNRHDFDTIMNVAADLSDRRADFQALTVQKLALLHFRRDELQDVQDLIKTHAHKFTSAERTSLRAAVIDFCVHKDTPNGNMWDAYHILRNDFDEMPRGERTRIMQNCFDRGRPDMAVHVFNHMRLHSREDTYPDASTYRAAFLGAANLRDAETLSAFHNQLRIDSTIDVTTGMRNALMMGMNATGQPRAALQVWDAIETSREGPSYESIVIALRACARTTFGDMKANDIWKRLRRNGIDLDQATWAAYAAALTGNGGTDTAITVLENAAQRNEVKMDESVIGSMYNASHRVNKAPQIQSWAEACYPAVWKSLQLKIEETSNEYGQPIKIFKLDDTIVL